MLRAFAVVSSLFVLTSTAFTSTAFAATLGPSKPSDLVDLHPSFGLCPLDPTSGFSLAIDTVNLPDGTTAPFVIPPKHVFVVTAAEINIQLAPVGHRIELSLFRVNGTQVGTLIAESEVTSTGTAQDHTVIPTGSVVKSGTPLCISAIDNDAGQQTLFPFGTVHGYFAKDK
jgi:hypothetical protein